MGGKTAVADADLKSTFMFMMCWWIYRQMGEKMGANQARI